MSNSSLVTYTRLSPNCNSPRNHVIDKITIHHMACNITVERCGEIFANPAREGSSNYGVDGYGHVGLYVDESDRAWTSGSRENDNRAVTIEVANDGGAPDWHVSDTAYNKLLDLVEDICRRNGIERLNFTGDATGNLTLHKYFQATGCPGPYLESRMPDIANEINRRLTGEETVTIPVNVTYQSYDQVKKKWLPEVTNRQDYAGNAGNAASGFKISADQGNITYCSRPVGAKEFGPMVINRNGYSGILDKPADSIMIKSDVTTLHYQVETVDGILLPPVTGFDANEPENGYAGLKGHAISKLWIWADPIIQKLEEPEDPEPPEETTPGGDEGGEETTPHTPGIWAQHGKMPWIEYEEEGETNMNATYQVYAGKWLPNVTDREDYAGNIGKAISAVFAKLSGGDIYYRVHTKGGKWLPEVKNREDYAGILGQPIDAIMARSDSAVIHVQAHLLGAGWLDAVTGYDERDPLNGYAGILGREIDAIYLWAEELPQGEPKPTEPTNPAPGDEKPVDGEKTALLDELLTISERIKRISEELRDKEENK